MTESPFQFVLDANVAIKLYINQPFSDKAIALLDLLQGDRSGICAVSNYPYGYLQL